jgi:Helix-hairpin-helix motif
MTIRHTRFLLRAAMLTLAFGLVTLGLSAAETAGGSGKVDLNSASEKELETLPGVGAATAKKIIAGRPYSSVSGLSKAGVPADTIAKITPLVVANRATASTAAPAKAPAAASQSASAAGAKAASPPPPGAPAKAGAASGTQRAPGRGTVWVNLDSGVYHYPNSRYYGKTKNGKYMPEADAMKAGYHAAKGEKKPQ